MSHTSFGPVIGGETWLRRAFKSVVRGSTVTVLVFPFTVRVTGIGPLIIFPPAAASGATAGESAATSGRDESATNAPTPTAPTPFRNRLRLNPSRESAIA